MPEPTPVPLWTSTPSVDAENPSRPPISIFAASRHRDYGPQVWVPETGHSAAAFTRLLPTPRRIGLVTLEAVPADAVTRDLRLRPGPCRHHHPAPALRVLRHRAHRLPSTPPAEYTSSASPAIP